MQNSKWPLWDPKCHKGLERCLPSGFGHYYQFSLNKFFDSSTPSKKKVDDGEEKEKKKENNVVYSGHLCHCQSTTRMPTDWNANHSCQVWNQFLILCTSYIFPPLSLYSYLPMLSIFHLFKMSCFPKVKTFILFPIYFSWTFLHFPYLLIFSIFWHT